MPDKITIMPDKITIMMDRAFSEWFEKSALRKDDDTYKLFAWYGWGACMKHYKVEDK